MTYAGVGRLSEGFGYIFLRISDGCNCPEKRNAREPTRHGGAHKWEKTMAACKDHATTMQPFKLRTFYTHKYYIY